MPTTLPGYAPDIYIYMANEIKERRMKQINVYSVLFENEVN